MVDGIRDFIKEDFPKLWKSATGRMAIGFILYLVGFQGDFGFALRKELRLLLEVLGLLSFSLGLWGIRFASLTSRFKRYAVRTLLILVAVFVGGVDIFNVVEDAEVNPTAMVSTSTPEPNASNHPTSQPTQALDSTTTPTLVPTSAPTHRPTQTSVGSLSGELVFSDSFDSVSQHWSLGSRADESASAVASITQGKFLVEAQFREGSVRWSRLYEDVSDLSHIEARDFDFQINAELLQAIPNGDVWITIHFRINNNFENYSLRVNQDQMYSLVVRKGSTETVVKGWIYNEIINPLEEGNNIRIIAVGPEFAILINGTEIDRIQDEELSILEPGGFAIGLRSSKDSFVIIEYDDLVIYKANSRSLD